MTDKSTDYNYAEGPDFRAQLAEKDKELKESQDRVGELETCLIELQVEFIDNDIKIKSLLEGE